MRRPIERVSAAAAMDLSSLTDGVCTARSEEGNLTSDDGRASLGARPGGPRDLPSSRRRACSSDRRAYRGPDGSRRRGPARGRLLPARHRPTIDGEESPKDYTIPSDLPTKRAAGDERPDAEPTRERSPSEFRSFVREERGRSALTPSASHGAPPRTAGGGGVAKVTTAGRPVRAPANRPRWGWVRPVPRRR